MFTTTTSLLQVSNVILLYKTTAMTIIPLMAILIARAHPHVKCYMLKLLKLKMFYHLKTFIHFSV